MFKKFSLSKLFHRVKDFFRDIPIKRKISVLFFIFILAPVSVIAFYSFNYSKEIINRKSVDYNIDLLTEMSHNIDYRLREVDKMTTLIVISSSVQQSVIQLNLNSTSAFKKIKIISNLEKELLSSSVTNEAVSGIIILSNKSDVIRISQPPTPFVLTGKEKELVDMGSGSLVWMSATRSVEPGIMAARVIYNLETQIKIGYLTVEYNGRVLDKILSEKKYFKSGEIFLINQDGVIISSNNNTNRWVKSPYYRYIGEEPHNSFKLEGGDNYLTYCVIPDTTWKLVSVLPTAQYEREIISLSRWIMLIAVICAVFAITLAYWLSGSMVRPIMDLCAMMQEVGRGNFNIKSNYHQRNEIGLLNDYFISMVNEIDKLIKEVYNQQILYHKAELNSLRMQINPHFIYNTLESINWLAHAKGNEDIVAMVKALGVFMRSSMSGGEYVPLEDEINNIKNYLIIQRFRYGDRLQFSISVQEEILKVPVPKLILQPLVENAIVHGLEKKIGIGHIELLGKAAGEDILISVRDDGIGIPPEKLERLLDTNKSDVRSGIGIINVDRRIKLYYGEAYGVNITSDYGVGTKVNITIPVVR